MRWLRAWRAGAWPGAAGRGRFWLGTAGPVAAVCLLAFGVFLAVPWTGEAPRRIQPERAAPRWVAAWTASSTRAEGDDAACPSVSGLRNVTVRNVMYLSTGGSQVRVRLTNVFGTRPLKVGRASVGISGQGASVIGANHVLTFAGKRSVTIPAGGLVFSDPVPLRVPSRAGLAVSLYFPEATGPVTQHPLALQDSYLSGPGDHVGDTTEAAYPRTLDCWMFADAVDVVASGQVSGAVVALGDSITDGYGSTPNTGQRWPDLLAGRLATRGGPTVSVVNAGISGNEVLIDRGAGRFGVSALKRFDRDVLSQSGVRAVILLEGINDIGGDSAPADRIIAGYLQLIARAHARGVRIFGGTLLPFTGSHAIFGNNYGTAWGERQRLAVNAWIRTGGAFDGVIDFDRVIADPADRSRMRPIYDSGDHLHPGNAGYAAMAAAVDVHALLKLRRPG